MGLTGCTGTGAGMGARSGAGTKAVGTLMGDRRGAMIGGVEKRQGTALILGLWMMGGLGQSLSLEEVGTGSVLWRQRWCGHK